MNDLPYTLRKPRGPRGTYSLRGVWDGIRYELSTRQRDEGAAWEMAARIWEAITTDPLINSDDPLPPGLRETIPEAMPLGAFEVFLMANFVLVGETVVQLGTGKQVLFHASAHGYRQATILWERRKKRVLEHRLKFFLHHRWLPRSVDHINRVRNNNALANLRASTPHLQSRNRGMPQFPSGAKSLNLLK